MKLTWPSDPWPTLSLPRTTCPPPADPALPPAAGPPNLQGRGQRPHTQPLSLSAFTSTPPPHGPCSSHTKSPPTVCLTLPSGSGHLLLFYSASPKRPTWSSLQGQSKAIGSRQLGDFSSPSSLQLPPSLGAGLTLGTCSQLPRLPGGLEVPDTRWGLLGGSNAPRRPGQEGET